MVTDTDGQSCRTQDDPWDCRGPIDQPEAAELMISVLTTDADRVGWRKRAACQAVTADLFFPVGGTGAAVEQIEAAKCVCQSCPVRGACLRFALETNQEFGIWGGTSEDERKRLRRTWLVRYPPQRRRVTV